MYFAFASKAATVSPCKSPYTTQFINNEDGTITKVCTRSSDKWIQIYNEFGKEVLSQQFHPVGGGEWVLKEQYKTTYKNDGVTVDYKEQFFCNGYTNSGYVGPASGCDIMFYHTYPNGRLRSLNCQQSPNNSNCVRARNNFCSPACSSCSNGVCSTCFGDYLLKNNTCLSSEVGCGSGYTKIGKICSKNPDNCTSVNTTDGSCSTCVENYLTSNGTCIPVSSCKNGFHVDGGACVANTVANCNTEINGKCTECKSGSLEQAGDCVSSCGDGYKQIENWCNRIRYTPAEAAEVLTDDNNNSVTITFRK